jgi:hypothetical protein
MIILMIHIYVNTTQFNVDIFIYLRFALKKYLFRQDATLSKKSGENIMMSSFNQSDKSCSVAAIIHFLSRENKYKPRRR